MIYSKSEIMMEAEYCASINKLQILTNGMVDYFTEQQLDTETLDAYTEAGGKIIETVMNFIHALAKKAGEFMDKIKSKFQELMDKQTIKSDLKKKLNIEKLRAAGKDKVEVPDIEKLQKLVAQSEKFVDDYAVKMESMVSKYVETARKGNKKAAKAMREKIDKYSKVSYETYQKLIKEINDVAGKKVKMSAEKFQADLQSGVDYAGSLEKAKNTMMQNIDRFADALSSLKSQYREYVEACMVTEGTSDKSPEAQFSEDVHTTVQKAANDVSKMTHEHASCCNVMLRCMGMNAQVFARLFAVSAVDVAKKADSWGGSKNKPGVKTSLKYAGAAVGSEAIGGVLNGAAKTMEDKKN